MFRRCPFYDICSPTDRLTIGNKEYHCLGSTSYDYCQRYKNLILHQRVGIISDPIEELNLVVRDLYRNLPPDIKDHVFIAILTKNCDVIYCDYSGLHDQIDFIKNVTRNNFQEITIGNFIVKKNEGNFGFFKISSTTLVAVKLTDDLEQFESLKFLFNNYSQKIDSVVERIERSKKAIIEKESSKVSFYSVICNLKSKLEDEVNAMDFARDLDNAIKSISQMYAWHPVIADISTFSSKLRTYQQEDLLTSKDKKELMSKISEWEKKVTQN